MGLTLLDPTSTVFQSMVSSGGTAETVLSDASDLTYLFATSPGHNVGVNVEDFVLPAGAVIKEVSAWIRQSNGGSPASFVVEIRDAALNVLRSHAFTATSSPTTYSTAPLAGPLTVAEINAMVWAAYAQTAAGRIQEAQLAVIYVDPPVIDVLAPTGTVSDTNRPTVQWTLDFLDTVGGPTWLTEAKIFSAAQYGAGGFNPSTSAAVETFSSPRSPTSWVPTNPLPDGTYRAYVRTGQIVNGQEHWSAWDFEQFTVSVLLPAAPALTLTAENASGRVRVDLAANAGDATTDVFDLERSTDGGVEWLPVRSGEGDDGRLTAAAPTVYDYEAPNGTETLYRARALHNYSGLYAAGAWTTASVAWSSSQWWIKHPLRPALNVPVELFSYSEVVEEARQAVIQPLGATLPVVMDDTRAGEAGTLIVQCRTVADQDLLKAILATVSTLLLQGPVADGHPDRYVRFGTRSSARVIDKSWAHITRESLPWTLDELPAGAQIGSQYTPPAGLVLDGGSASTTTFGSTVDGGSA